MMVKFAFLCDFVRQNNAFILSIEARKNIA